MRLVLSLWVRRHAWALLALLIGAAAARTARGQAEVAGEVEPESDWRPQVESYTVQQGDTLWHISERVVGSPWLWPRVWAYNPEITNPNWIYPGDILRFRPSELELPRMTELIAGQREMPEDTQAEIEPAPEPKESRSGTPVVQHIQLGPRRQRTGPRTMVDLFVTERELEESGVLTNAIEDKLLLSKGDRVFVTFPDGQTGKTGQRYMTYRTTHEVRHPVSGDRVGYVTQVTGFLTVESSTDDLSRAKVTDSLIELERGQLVTPLVQVPVVDLKLRPARQIIEGVVLAVETGLERTAGERRLVFIDLGKQNGIEVGNKLNAFVEGDPVAPGRRLPPMQVGTLVVVDVEETASTCIVVDARREIEPGLMVRTVLSHVPGGG